jgi:GNAT superfamily N-acetyltransferase
MAYDIVSYAPELQGQIAELQTHLWSGDLARNAAYLKWKYLDNPFLDQILIRVALCEGRAVAMRGLFGALWEVDDTRTRHLLPYADDFVVVPEHRNRGVASQVMRAALDAGAERGLAFAVSLSAGAITFVNSLAAGWRAAGSYQSAWRTLHRGRAQRRVDALRQAFGPRGLFDRLDRRIGEGAGRVSLSGEPRPQAMAGLIARLPWDGRIRHVRDVDYLAWRFRNPLHEYRFLFWEEGGLQGYLVLQRYLSERAEQCVNIVDWEAVDERVRAGLLQAALDWGRFGGVRVWTINASEPVRTLLRAHGFAVAEAGGVRGRSSGLLVRRLGASPSAEPWRLGSRNLLDIGDWDLRMLYSMAG